VHTKLKENQNFDTCLRLMKNADYVLLHFTDMLGYLKGRTIPAEQAQNALADGVTFDGSSMVGGANIEDSDMIMKPDPATFTVCPHYFYDKSVASLICDVKQPDGAQFETDPRHLLRKTLGKTLAEGYQPTAAAD
jgi:glutamine synthetase